MKKNQQIVKVILVASLLFMGGSDLAYAQFGKLKGLVNKAKSEVKNKANDAKNGAVSSATSQASEAAGVSAADGSGKVASNGYTIKWRWEDKSLGEDYARLHWAAPKSEIWASQILWLYDVVGPVVSHGDFFMGSARSGKYMDFGGKYVPSDEPLRYAWTKNFVDDPSFNNWIYFCYVLPFQCVNWYGNYRYLMDDYSNGIVKADNNMMLAWSSEQQMLDERNAREEYAIELAWEKEPIEKMAQYGSFLLKQVRDKFAKGTADVDLVWKLFQVIAIKDLMIDKNPNLAKFKDNDAVRQFSSDYINPKLFTGEPYTGQYFDIINAYRNGSMAKQEVPAGVAVDAATKNGGISAGKTSAQNFGEQFVEVIYKEKDWHTFKSPKYPYPITHYSLAISLITKKGDSYIMRNGNLQKTKAGKYQIQIGMDGTASGVPVNYKK